MSIHAHCISACTFRTFSKLLNPTEPDINGTCRRMGDTFRARRECTDLVCSAFARAFNPHQHCGLDEATRSTKHWEKQRIKFKASVHSGTLVDMLNDCRTGYCMWFEEQMWRPKDKAETNQILVRLKRAAQCLVEKKKDRQGRSTAAYCISLDRGYGNVAAQNRLWVEDGIYTNAMVTSNRVGLPREYIELVRKELSACPKVGNKKCTHRPDDAECRKWMWTVLNKPPFELNLWQDTKMIMSYGNFFSSVRAGELARGNRGQRDSFAVWVPESIHHYNIEGRSATDSADQARKKLSMAERRIERAGQKGMAFVFDVAFTNGSIMKKHMQPLTRMRAFEEEHTKARFCQRWVQEVLDRGITFRRRVNDDIVSHPRFAMTPSLSSVQDISSSASKVSGKKEAGHVLVDLYAKAVEEQAKPKKGRPRKLKPKVKFRRGHCGRRGKDGKRVPCPLHKKQGRSALFCEQCRAFYHMPCFFEQHVFSAVR